MGDRVKEGYRLSVIDPEGTILSDIDLHDYDLTKSIARSDIVNQIQEALPPEALDPPEEVNGIADELRRLSNRLEAKLAEGDNPVSAKCSLVLGETPKCYDFSGTRRYAACRAWDLMESEKISWQEAISRAWQEVKEICTWN